MEIKTYIMILIMLNILVVMLLMLNILVVMLIKMIIMIVGTQGNTARLDVVGGDTTLHFDPTREDLSKDGTEL